MKKEDLKYGNVVELRNSYKLFYHQFRGGGLLHLNGEGYIELHNFKEDLTDIDCVSRLDIVKVYEDYTCTKLLWERKEKSKIVLTDDEKAILKNLSKEYKYIARDENGGLYIFTVKPKKNPYGIQKWNTEFVKEYEIFTFYNHLFKFVKWEDEEPYSIEELLNDK